MIWGLLLKLSYSDDNLWACHAVYPPNHSILPETQRNKLLQETSIGTIMPFQWELIPCQSEEIDYQSCVGRQTLLWLVLCEKWPQNTTEWDIYSMMFCFNPSRAKCILYFAMEKMKGSKSDKIRPRIRKIAYLLFNYCFWHDKQQFVF